MNVDKTLNMAAGSGLFIRCVPVNAMDPPNFDKSLGGLLCKFRWIVTCLAIIFLLTGCGTSSGGKLQDLEVGECSFTEPARAPDGNLSFESEIQTEVNNETPSDPADTAHTEPPAIHKSTTYLSVQGYKDSPNNQALKEWLDFCEAYDTDRTLMKANNRNESNVPAHYLGYGCYTQDMADKLDEILEKYGLAMLTNENLIQYGESQRWLDALHIDGLFRKDVNAEFTYVSGWFYSEGTFQMNCDLRLTQEDAAWTYTAFPCYSYSVKKCLDPTYLSVGDVDSYEQWKYTASDGNEVLLALNSKRAIIVCEQDDAFITVYMQAYSDPNSSERMSKLALEQIAETFDFSICPTL